MTGMQEASLAVLAQAVLDLAGADDRRTEALRMRLAKLPPQALDAARRAREITGYRSPDLACPLESIFGLVRIEETPGAKCQEPAQRSHQHPLLLRPVALGPKPNYPLQEVEAQDLQQAAAHLRESLLADLETVQPEVDALLFLLEKYAGFVSAGREAVAFADQVQTGAAVASAVAAGAGRLLFVGADFSGIQRFIYTISSKGALKSLRARSFFLELLAEHVSRSMLESLGLTRASLVYVGGGHVYLMAPDLPETRAVIDETRRAQNAWLLKNLGGSVYLALASVPAKLEQMGPAGQDVPQLWQALANALGTEKDRRFQGWVQEPSFWEPQRLGKATCEVCHQQTDNPRPLHPAESDEPVPVACPLCTALFRAGGHLPRARYVVAGEPGDAADLEVGDVGYYLASDLGKARSIPGRRALMVMNSLSAADYVEPGAYPMWLSRYYAKATGDSYTMATFEELAMTATGAPLLGVLRMDVDHLGHVFSRGLPARYGDFARTAGLSRSLSHFFKLHLDGICARDTAGDFEPLNLARQSGPRPVTVVYSGGDDLFVVGAWDQTLELAFDIHRAFTKYTGGHLTISGGLVARDDRWPLHHLAQEAGEAEEAAKVCRNSFAPLFTGSSERKAGRTKVAAVTWSRAQELVEGLLEPALGPLGHEGHVGTRLPRGFTYRLLGLADYWLEHGPLYLPRLAYSLARVGGVERDDPTWRELRGYLMRTDIGQLPPFVRWLDLLGRGGRENG